MLHLPITCLAVDPHHKLQKSTWIPKAVEGVKEK